LPPKFGDNYKLGYIGFLIPADGPTCSGILHFPREIPLASLRALRAFVIVGENRAMEATAARGVRETPLEKFIDDPRLSVVFRKPRKLDAAAGQRVAEAALAQSGLRYDQILTAARFLSASFLGRWLRSAFPEPAARFPGLLEDRADPWLSAEFAAHCLAAVPHYADTGILARRAHPIHPQELFEDSDLFAAWKFSDPAPAN